MANSKAIPVFALKLVREPRKCGVVWRVSPRQMSDEAERCLSGDGQESKQRISLVNCIISIMSLNLSGSRSTRQMTVSHGGGNGTILDSNAMCLGKLDRDSTHDEIRQYLADPMIVQDIEAFSRIHHKALCAHGKHLNAWPRQHNQ